MQKESLWATARIPPKVEWPNGARIALSLVVNYEEGSEYSTLDGDAQGEVMGEAPSRYRSVSAISPTNRFLSMAAG